jgi:hypothetical protein
MKWNTLAVALPIMGAGLPLAVMAEEAEVEIYEDPVQSQIQDEAGRMQNLAQNNLAAESEKLDELEAEKEQLGEQTYPDDADLKQAEEALDQAQDNADVLQESLDLAQETKDAAQEKADEAKEDLKAAEQELEAVSSEHSFQTLKELIDQVHANEEAADDAYSAFVAANNNVINKHKDLEAAYNEFKTAVNSLSADNMMTNLYLDAILQETASYSKTYKEFTDLMLEAAMKNNEGTLDKADLDQYEHEADDLEDILDSMSASLNMWKDAFQTNTDVSHKDSDLALQTGHAYLALLETKNPGQEAVQTTKDLLEKIQSADDFLTQHPEFIQDVLHLSDWNVAHINAIAQVNWETFTYDKAQEALRLAQANLDDVQSQWEEAQTVLKAAREEKDLQQTLYDQALASWQEWLAKYLEINRLIALQEEKVQDAQAFLAYADQVVLDTSQALYFYRAEPWYGPYNELLNQFYGIMILPDDILIEEGGDIALLPDDILIEDGGDIVLLPDDILIEEVSASPVYTAADGGLAWMLAGLGSLILAAGIFKKTQL